MTGNGIEVNFFVGYKSYQKERERDFFIKKKKKESSIKENGLENFKN